MYAGRTAFVAGRSSVVMLRSIYRPSAGDREAGDVTICGVVFSSRQDWASCIRGEGERRCISNFSMTWDRIDPKYVCTCPVNSSIGHSVLNSPDTTPHARSMHFRSVHLYPEFGRAFCKV